MPENTLPTKYDFAATEERSPNQTTLSPASRSKRVPVSVTTCPGSAWAGRT